MVPAIKSKLAFSFLVDQFDDGFREVCFHFIEHNNLEVSESCIFQRSQVVVLDVVAVL